MQPHVRKFHQGLGTLQLHTWKLSGTLSERQVFLRWLCKLQLQTSGGPLLPCTSPSGPGSSVGVIDGVSIPAKRLFLKWPSSFFFLAKKKKGCGAVLNHVFSLTGMDLAANTVVSQIFRSFERLCPPWEV